MSHLMADGVTPCASSDGHKDSHRSAASRRQRRGYWQRYNGTAAGITRNVRSEAKRRGNRVR